MKCLLVILVVLLVKTDDKVVSASELKLLELNNISDLLTVVLGSTDKSTNGSNECSSDVDEAKIIKEIEDIIYNIQLILKNLLSDIVRYLSGEDVIKNVDCGTELLINCKSLDLKFIKLIKFIKNLLDRLIEKLIVKCNTLDLIHLLSNVIKGAQNVIDNIVDDLYLLIKLKLKKIIYLLDWIKICENCTQPSKNCTQPSQECKDNTELITKIIKEALKLIDVLLGKCTLLGNLINKILQILGLGKSDLLSSDIKQLLSDVESVVGNLIG